MLRAAYVCVANLMPVLVLDQYRAVANYKKQNKGELSFATGDLFEVVEKNDNGKYAIICHRLLADINLFRLVVCKFRR